MKTTAPKGTKLVDCMLRDQLKSLNAYTGGHWASKSTSKHWQETKRFWLPVLRAEMGIPQEHNNHVRRVVIERWLAPRQRKWDDENLYGGSVKSINDALVRLGWLKDDSPDWRILELKQIKPNELDEVYLGWWLERKIRTRILVYDLGEK